MRNVFAERLEYALFIEGIQLGNWIWFISGVKCLSGLGCFSAYWSGSQCLQVFPSALDGPQRLRVFLALWGVS
jgi:hypothetical protein